jgi:hypothetical protein
VTKVNTTDMDALRERYRSCRDEELVTMALTAAAELTPTAVELFKVEIMGRRLVPALWPTLDIPVDSMSRERPSDWRRVLPWMPALPREGRCVEDLPAQAGPAVASFRSPPTWVFRHAALFIRFESNTAALAALLRFDYAGFLQAIHPRASRTPA